MCPLPIKIRVQFFNSKSLKVSIMISNPFCGWNLPIEPKIKLLDGIFKSFLSFDFVILIFGKFTHRLDLNNLPLKFLKI